MQAGAGYHHDWRHKPRGLFALQLPEKTFHVQSMLGLSLPKSGENCHGTRRERQLCEVHSGRLRSLRVTVGHAFLERFAGGLRSFTAAAAPSIFVVECTANTLQTNLMPHERQSRRAS